MTKIQRALLAITAPLLSFTPGGSAYLDVRQRQLIFAPTKSTAVSTHALGEAQSRVVVNLVQAPDLVRLHAWWAPAESADAPAVLYLHGAVHSLAGNAERIAYWQRMGYSVLAIEYRGFGDNPGELPTEASVYRDAQIGWQYLKQLQPDPAKRFVYGHSLGGAIAIELALRESDAAGLIVESSFTSVREMARNYVVSWMPMLGRLITHRFDSISKVAQLEMPALFMHGVRDEAVPYDMSERLFARAPQRKRLELFATGHHGDLPNVAAADYQQAVHRFIADCGGDVPRV